MWVEGCVRTQLVRGGISLLLLRTVEEPRGLLQPCLDVPMKPPCLATASLQEEVWAGSPEVKLLPQR